MEKLMTENSKDMWAVVFPDGRIVTGSDLETEDDAWRIALGWPAPDDILAAKHNGVIAVKARLCWTPKPKTYHQGA